MGIDAARIPADRCPDRCGDHAGIEQECFQGMTVELRTVFEGLVEIFHISSLMPVMVDRHCLRAQAGDKRITGIGQRLELERIMAHGAPTFLSA